MVRGVDSIYITGGSEAWRSSLMKQAVRYLIAVWILSRIMYYMAAQFNTFVWDEIYWFINWFGLLFFVLLIRNLLKLTVLSQETIRTLRSELLKLGLIFVSLILWEIVFCINQEVATSEWMILLMLLVTGLITSWMILEAK
jgi:hypothetical protein